MICFKENYFFLAQIGESVTSKLHQHISLCSSYQLLDSEDCWLPFQSTSQNIRAQKLLSCKRRTVLACLKRFMPISRLCSLSRSSPRISIFKIFTYLHIYTVHNKDFTCLVTALLFMYTYVYVVFAYWVFFVFLIFITISISRPKCCLTGMGSVEFAPNGDGPVIKDDMHSSQLLLSVRCGCNAAVIEDPIDATSSGAMTANDAPRPFRYCISNTGPWHESGTEWRVHFPNCFNYTCQRCTALYAHT